MSNFTKVILGLIICFIIVFSFSPVHAEEVKVQPIGFLNDIKEIQEVKFVDFSMNYTEEENVIIILDERECFYIFPCVLNAENLVHTDIPGDILSILWTSYSYEESEGCFIFKENESLKEKVYINAFLDTKTDIVYIGEFYKEINAVKIYNNDDYFMNMVFQDDVKVYFPIGEILFKGIEIRKVLLN